MIGYSESLGRRFESYRAHHFLFGNPIAMWVRDHELSYRGYPELSASRYIKKSMAYRVVAGPIGPRSRATAQSGACLTFDGRA